jgi:hypothetical protein
MRNLELGSLGTVQLIKEIALFLRYFFSRWHFTSRRWNCVPINLKEKGIKAYSN